MRIGETVRLLRVFHDMQQKALAARLGMRAGYLSEIEKGRKTPSLEVLGRIAGAFDMPLSVLFLFAEMAALPPGSPLPQFPTPKTLGMLEMSRMRLRAPA